MDIEFAGDVLAVGDDGVHGDTEYIGYLLVAQSSHHLDQHIAFAVG